MKIATKYLLFVLVPVVISVVVISMGLYRRSSHALMEEVDRRLAYTARHIKNMMEGSIERAKGDLLALLANKSLEEYFMYLNIREMDYVEDARATLEENFIKIARAKPGYPTLRIFRKDAGGIVNITDNRATHKYPDPTATEWFTSAFGLSEGEGYVSNIHSCPEHHKPSLFISQPYYYLGRIHAVGIIHLHTQEFFGAILRDVEIGQTGYAYLVNRDGVVVAHKDSSLAGSEVSELLSTQRVTKGEEGGCIETDRPAGLRFKKSYLPLELKGVGIVVAQPLKEALAVSNSVRWYVIGISSVVAVFLLMLLFLVSRKLVINPVRRLSSATQKILKGDLTARVSSGNPLKCWELRQCEEPECPAFGDEQRACWQISGTRCPTCVEGDYAVKIEQCETCEVYQAASGDEIQELTHNFNLMALSLSENITGLQDTERRLRQQGQLLQTILDATPDSVSLQDGDLIYRAANKSFCRMLGRLEDDIVGCTNHELFPPDRAQSYQQEDLAVLRSGRSLAKEHELGDDTATRWLHVMKTPVVDNEGKTIGLLCSCRDITELKKMQEQLTRAQKMETVGQLTAGIAHEINTPLGIILGYAQLLMEDIDPDNQAHDDLKTIVKQTLICRKIVADLLGFSRHTESTISLVDLNRSIQEVIAVLEHTFGLDKVAIATDLDADLPKVQCDGEKLKQVLANLLGNAHDAIGTDGTIRVKTRFDKIGKEVIIYVADTGKGIPSNKIERIFDPFYTTKPVGRGTGLGLSVTFGIVQEHGGKIEVESPPVSLKADDDSLKKGTLFIIYLPLENSALSEEEEHGENIGVG